MVGIVIGGFHTNHVHQLNRGLLQLGAARRQLSTSVIN